MAANNLNLILLGAPGAGKGTQAQFIKEKYFLPQISTGEILREARQNRTPMGVKAEEFMKKGQLVPDDVVIGIVDDRLKQEDCANGFLLDGFPRTVAQADALANLLGKSGKNISHVLSIDVPENELLVRLTGRRTCAKCGAGYHVSFAPPKKEGICDKCGGNLVQREDDSEATIRNRLVVYRQQTEPLIGYYKERKMLVAIDGQKHVDAVRAQIESVLAG